MNALHTAGFLGFQPREMGLLTGVTENVAGSLRCGSPGITLCDCSSYCGSLIVSNGEESAEIPGWWVTVDKPKPLG